MLIAVSVLIFCTISVAEVNERTRNNISIFKLTWSHQPSLTYVRPVGTLALHTHALPRRKTTEDRFDGAEELFVAAMITLVASVERGGARVREVPFVAVVAQRPEL
jgi:hypothetical protein